MNKFRTIIPQVKYLDLIKTEPPIKLLRPEPVDGNTTLFELTVMNKIVKTQRVTKAFEIGTFNGRTALNIAANMSVSGKVWTLDLPKNKSTKTQLAINPKDKSGWSDMVYIEKNVTGKLFKRSTENKKITQLLGDSANFDFSPFYGKMDLVFVDGSHTAAYVQNDSQVALKLIRKNGIVIWHDYSVWHDATSVLNKLYKKGGPFKRMKHIQGTTMVIIK